MSLLRRWRTISYIITPAATDTLSDEMLPNMGNDTMVSQRRNASGEMPVSSAPITSATGVVRSAWVYEIEAFSDAATI